MRERRDVAVKCSTELAQDSESQVSVAPLDAADIRAIKLCAMGKLFLSPIERLATLSYPLPEYF
jgi:hypothetical protein